MRLLAVALALVGAAAACSGDTPPSIDANPLGPRCAMNFYDLCFEEHDCPQPMLCQNFATQGFQVCTTSCDASNPCPKDRTGAAGECMGGICVPSQPNMCHLP